MRSILPSAVNSYRILTRNVVTYRRFLPVVRVVSFSCHNMAQRSITSFFIKTPKKSLDNPDEGPAAELNDSKCEGAPSGDDSSSSPKETKPAVKVEKTQKRQRMQSSDSEASDDKEIKLPVRPDKKRTPKRQRIESTDSEPSSTIKSPEQITPKTKSKASTKTPTSKKTEKKSKPQKSPLVEKNTNVTPASLNKVKEEIVKDSAAEKDDKKQDIMEKVTESSYNPAKNKYHPIEDACWARGERVPYLALAKTLEAIEATSARLRIVETLSNYLRSVLVLTPEDLLPSVYMCLNRLAPAYESLELGVAETCLMKAIAQSTGRTFAQVKADASKVGDLGLVAEQSRSTQRVMFRPAPLTLRHVFQALKDIAKMTGHSSMNKKIGKIQSLFVACREAEARYLIRSLAGKLRVGLAEQSVLQALAQATLTTPPGQPWPPAVLDASRGLSPEAFKAKIDEQALVIKTTYCECPNYEQLLTVMLQHGVHVLPEHCRLTPGVPLKPMLAHPTKGVHEVFQRFEKCTFTCEWKYDGERAQLHVPAGADGRADVAAASVFSRNQENNTSKFPDVLARLPAVLAPTVASCVLDCEAVAWDCQTEQILPFQVLSTRKRKDARVEDIKVQVCLFMFDLLYLNGRSLVREPLAERRRLLRENFIVVPGQWMLATSRDCGTLEEVQEFLEESVRGSCEGLMVKTLAGRDATYEIAKRSRNWLKLKKDYMDGVGDTFDAVVIGAYHGRGKRTGVFGGFLLACYDTESEEYQSLCKIGTGFTDQDLQDHSASLRQYVVDAPRGYYRYDASHEPDVWLAAGAVWEVRCADLSLSPAHRAAIGLVDPDKGISLRFPRFVRVREDKGPEQATSARQVADIYLGQDQVKNQAAPTRLDDDFY